MVDWTIAKGPLAVAELRQLAQETAPSAYERGELKGVVGGPNGLARLGGGREAAGGGGSEK